jgi:transposase
MEVPVCPVCRERDARLAEHAASITALEEETRQFRALLHRNASNFSVPPSAKPAAVPPPVTKPKMNRRPGGQPGHPPHLKQLLPPERVTRTVTFVATQCAHCKHPLPPEPGPAYEA